MKSAVYKAVHANKVLIQSAKGFAEYADKNLKVCVSFVSSSNIPQFEIPCAVHILGTQAVHFVNRKKNANDETCLEFYKNSQFQQSGDEPIDTVTYCGGTASFVQTATHSSSDTLDSNSVSANLTGSKVL